jgi:hypothetical protein
MYFTEDGKGEFWDSYGQAPGFYSQNFTQFLKFTQAISSDVCGKYTLFFALHRCRHIPLEGWWIDVLGFLWFYFCGQFQDGFRFSENFSKQFPAVVVEILPLT